MVKPHINRQSSLYKQRRCALRFVTSTKQNKASKLKLNAEILFFPVCKMCKDIVIRDQDHVEAATRVFCASCL